jgi:hypothetical protein
LTFFFPTFPLNPLPPSDDICSQWSIGFIRICLATLLVKQERPQRWWLHEKFDRAIMHAISVTKNDFLTWRTDGMQAIQEACREYLQFTRALACHTDPEQAPKAGDSESDDDAEVVAQ